MWIGANCSIVYGSKINNGAVIGANSLVNKEIEEYTVAVGLPAKEIKHRR